MTSSLRGKIDLKTENKFQKYHFFQGVPQVKNLCYIYCLRYRVKRINN